MGDLLAILSAAQTSLGAQRGLTATASHNIENANNPNYARQIAVLDAVVPADQVAGGYIGRGAVLGSVTQARDRFIEAQLPAVFGNAARSTAESDALQAFHGLDPGAGAGLDTAISGFYASLRALVQNPSDSGLRASALGATRTMTQAFNRTAQQIEAARTGLDAQVTGLVATINGEAKAIADLNLQIRQASASGAPNDLLDLRQKHVDALVQLTGAAPVQSANGDVNLLVGGVALVAGAHAGSVTTQADDTNGGHSRILFTGPDGTTGTAVAVAAIGGSLGGTLAARDVTLRSTGDRVDRLAHDLATAVNAANGYDPVTGAGQVFSFPVDASDPTRTLPGTAASLSLVLADPAKLAPPIDPASTGDATLAKALVATETQPMAGANGVQSALSAIVSEFGASASGAKALADQDAGLKDQLVKMRDSVSGVSIDDEMVAIQSAQRGYEAIAKVITAADAMMETLMNMIK